MKPMKRQAYYAMALAVLAIILTADGLLSHDYYVEDREVQQSDGVLKSHIGYGLLDVHNQSKLKFNGSTVSTEDKYQDYQDFIGASNVTRAMNAGSQQYAITLVSLVLLVLFVPMVFLSHQGYFDERLGRMGPYIPLIVAQIAALLLIIGTLWFTYAFATGLDADVAQLHQERYQAIGGMAAFYVIVGGFLIQVAAIMALSRTRLIYIEPLDEGKTPRPLE